MSVLHWTILLLIAIIAAILTIRTTKHPSWHLLYLIPFSLWGFSSAYFGYNSLLGYPISIASLSFSPSPSDELIAEKLEGARLLAFWVPTINYDPITNDPTHLSLWLIMKNEQIPRAVDIRYTRKDHEELQRAQERIANGVPQIIGAKTSKKQNQSDSVTSSSSSEGQYPDSGSSKSLNGKNEGSTSILGVIRDFEDQSAYQKESR